MGSENKKRAHGPFDQVGGFGGGGRNAVWELTRPTPGRMQAVPGGTAAGVCGKTAPPRRVPCLHAPLPPRTEPQVQPANRDRRLVPRHPLRHPGPMHPSHRPTDHPVAHHPAHNPPLVPSKRPRPTVWYCSMSCQSCRWRLAWKSSAMVDLTDEERAAVTATMKWLALPIDEIGWPQPAESCRSR